MILFELLTMTERDTGESIECLVERPRTFETSRDLEKDIELNGHRYLGKKLVLLSEEQVKRVVTVESETKYRAVTNGNGKPVSNNNA